MGSNPFVWVLAWVQVYVVGIPLLCVMRLYLLHARVFPPFFGKFNQGFFIPRRFPTRKFLSAFCRRCLSLHIIFPEGMNPQTARTLSRIQVCFSPKSKQKSLPFTKCELNSGPCHENNLGDHNYYYTMICKTEVYSCISDVCYRARAHRSM